MVKYGVDVLSTVSILVIFSLDILSPLSFLNFYFKHDVGVVPLSTRLIHGDHSVQPKICRSSISSNVRKLSMRLGRQEW